MRAPNTSTSTGAYGAVGETYETYDGRGEPRARWGTPGQTSWRAPRDAAATGMTSITGTAVEHDPRTYGAAAPPRSSLAPYGAAPAALYPAPASERAERETGLGAGMGSATALPARPYMPYTAPGAAVALDPDVWLIALPTGSGAMRSLEGMDRPGAIRVSRPYGHLRTIRPITPLRVLAADMDGLDGLDGAASTAMTDPSGPLGARVVTDGLGPASPDRAGGSAARRVRAARPARIARAALPAQRPAPQIISAVEVETDAGVFRVERPGGVLDNSDMAWALAHMEQGEPDSVVGLPRRQLALLLTLLPTPEDETQPERDPHWGWAHRLRGPWERGPLHPKGRLGRLIAIDPDLTGRGLHRACFELLGADEVVWAMGVPCFRQGSVYELTPLGKTSLSRWLSWPLAKVRRRAGGFERPDWEIARVVYRVGQPRWPLAGVVEPLGPMGVSG